MTVYKAVRKEAAAASKLAIALIQGQSAAVTGSVKDPQSGRAVPSVLLPAEAITKKNVGDVIKDGGATYAQVCTADLLAKCKAAGLSG